MCYMSVAIINIIIEGDIVELIISFLELWFTPTSQPYIYIVIFFLMRIIRESFKTMEPP